MKTTYKLIVLVAIAVAAMLVLAWVNQQTVRDVGPRPTVGQSEF